MLFSAYQLTKIYAKLGKPIECEMWAQRATVMDPERNEALLALVEYLRERGENYKVWHYLLRADREKLQQELFFGGRQLRVARRLLAIHRSLLCVPGSRRGHAAHPSGAP